MTTETATKPRLERGAPQFLVLDVDKSAAYYREKLGFTLDFIYGGFYASVSRDDVTIHLKLVDEADPCRALRLEGEHLDIYIRTAGVEALYAELQQRGAAILRPLEQTEWGTREFAVEDDNGYILYFGEPVS